MRLVEVMSRLRGFSAGHQDLGTLCAAGVARQAHPDSGSTLVGRADHAHSHLWVRTAQAPRRFIHGKRAGPSLVATSGPTGSNDSDDESKGGKPPAKKTKSKYFR
ncbi:hypothetical protein GN958_ATG22475 [Phytophthora infestans]|uniref:Uncharacterized protein n=1 Tax=Phytophthora infestans TaxID=4787 RepID=A0A8S9TNE9_PHYIN|nr:hypothetical protein GN958_ATG22475 [Phytophthora infestans]